MIEVYDLLKSGETGGDKPCSQTILDYEVNSFDFVSDSCIVVADNMSNLIILKNIQDQKGLVLHIAKTKFDRLKDLKVFCEPNQPKFLAAIAHQGTEGKLALWSCQSIESWDKDLE